MAFLSRRASLAVISVVATGVPLLLAAPAGAASSLAAPTGLAPNSATIPQKDPVLSWGNVSGASDYQVEVSKSNDWSDTSTQVALPDSGDTSTTSLALPVTLSPATYFWRVRASNPSATGDWSASASLDKAWLDAPSTAGSTPTGDSTVTPADLTSSPWRFAWTPIQDASSYEVEFSIYPTFDTSTDSGKDHDSSSTVACLTAATSLTPYSTVAVPDAGMDACDFSEYPINLPTYWRVRGIDDSDSALTDEGVAVPVECYGTSNTEPQEVPNSSETTAVALGTPTSTGQECSQWSATKLAPGVVSGAGGVAESTLGDVTGTQLNDCTGSSTNGYACTSMPELSWNPVANANQYSVTIADDPQFDDVEHTYQTPFLTLTPRDVIPDYTAGKGYYVAVRACTDGTGAIASDGCSLAQVVTFTLATKPVTGLAQTKVDGGELLSWTDQLAGYTSEGAATGGSAAEATNYKVQVADATDTSFDQPVLSETVDAACNRSVFSAACYNPTGPTAPVAGTDSVVVSPTASGSYIWRVIPFNESGLGEPAAASSSSFTVDLTKPAFKFSTKSGFAVNGALTVVSSEPVVTPVNTTTLKVVPQGAALSAAVAGTIHQGANNTTWVFTPTHALATGGSYVLSVDSSVIDDNGNSAVVSGSAIRATTVAKDTSAGWTYSSGWTKHVASGARSGSYKSAGSGKTASLVVVGSEAVLYGCKTPHMGTISVTVGGKTTSVSEHQSFTRCGVQLWSKALPSGNQTITVKVTHGTGNLDEAKVS